MPSLETELTDEMAAWEAAGLRRALDDQREGRVDFASNDYLGLSTDPSVIAAAREALERFGAGSRASRLLGGGTPLHERAEAAAAQWLGAQAALLFPSGFQANLGILATLAGRGDAVFTDQLVHASWIDGARLSHARVHVHRHLDLEELERGLRHARGARRRIVVTESIFSMDGDAPDLNALHEICARHAAGLIVDEAHSAGLLGSEGSGAWNAAGLDPDSPTLIARIVTGGKALGVAGALVVGSRTLREHLLNRARAFVFTTAPPPALAGGLCAAIERCRAADNERARALKLARQLAQRLGMQLPAAAIVPYVIGDAEGALELAETAKAKGFDVRAVRPPSVPENTSRLRLVCHATNTDAEADELARMLPRTKPKSTPTPPATKTSRARTGRTLFVVGTDTGVGKTVASALLLLAAKRRGPAAYWKPVQTGPDSDTETVANLTGAAPHELLRPAWSLTLPASPHEAAAHEATTIDPSKIEGALEGLERTLGHAHRVVELAGGLFVPYTLDVTQADWLERKGAACILVARSGLGTLNHTLLTLEALRTRHIVPEALLLVGERHDSNRETLCRMGQIERVFEIEPFAVLERLALDAWLDANPLDGLFV